MLSHSLKEVLKKKKFLEANRRGLAKGGPAFRLMAPSPKRHFPAKKRVVRYRREEGVDEGKDCSPVGTWGQRQKKKHTAIKSGGKEWKRGKAQARGGRVFAAEPSWPPRQGKGLCEGGGGGKGQNGSRIGFGQKGKFWGKGIFATNLGEAKRKGWIEGVEVSGGERTSTDSGSR